RINELGYFTQFDANNTPIQSSYVRVPGAFEIVAGPLRAPGPGGGTAHTPPNITAPGRKIPPPHVSFGIDPIGPDPAFPGLHNVFREGDPTADLVRGPVDFYSPDTFNYAVLEVAACPATLTVSLFGIDSYAVNTFPQPANPSTV